MIPDDPQTMTMFPVDQSDNSEPGKKEAVTISFFSGMIKRACIDPKNTIRGEEVQREPRLRIAGKTQRAHCLSRNHSEVHSYGLGSRPQSNCDNSRTSIHHSDRRCPPPEQIDDIRLNFSHLGSNELCSKTHTEMSEKPRRNNHKFLQGWLHDMSVRNDVPKRRSV
ncbi:uncharacterized protein LY89DRAFT_335171 [Mollisia scopiformis]|uniref:Uncharacterized protein n=1 Tax=Mollisia scopiformis TaxID=149040 RepID=A0A132B9S1_MOLSC|nr:uncharacterized protein LY89DRAFT_335171 [Mollisia scopiformis]KUJ08614.1 hypothetical protein LY89DRAFT_335171 [Mollisia scopiformis]